MAKIDEMDFCGELCLFAEELIEKARKPKWIPVSERLPDEEDLVLIICKNGARFVGYYKRFHDGEPSWGIKTALGSSRWLNKGRVTHWMPLPEPPQEVI